MDNAILELIKLASVGILAGLFSSVVANRDHRQRKWWELRVATYQAVIEALSDLVHYYDVKYSAAIEQRELPKEFEAELSHNWDAAYPKIRKAADAGAFLFSTEADAALQAFVKDGDYQSYEEDLDSNLAKSKKCLSTLVACSKKDLRLNPGWFERLS